MPIQSPLVFYPWHWFKMARGAFAYLSTFVRLRLIVRRIEADPNRFAYRDAALTLSGGEDDLVTSTRITDYARRRMTNSARSRAEAAVS